MSTTYQEAIENSNIVSKTDINGIITFVNDEFCKISGYSYDELIGQNHNIVRHPDVQASSFEVLWKTILDKKPYKATVKNLTKDKKTVYLNTTITPILDDFGNIIEFIAIRYDVTFEVELKKSLEQKEKELEELNQNLELKVLEQTKQLKELNKTLEKRVQEEISKNDEKQKLLFWQSRMASLGQMLGNIAHQWRQPLTELNLTLFNMKKASLNKDEKKVEELYKESKNLISGMSTTIEDFTNFFNPLKEKKSFEIKDVINEVLTILRKVIEQEEIKIKVDVPINYKILGVSNELAQVLINLIQNSKDAFRQNEIKDKNIFISLKEKKNLDKKSVILEIEDNAGGIKEENLDSIFEPYFTTKHKSQGTGLGLFMSKMIIEKSLEGTLSHRNSKNGSIFTITIFLNEKE
ncbi:PAS domain-containing sensor histidine kinase [Arcobacter ellisii]|uniref:histidine kinase n=1 Tax=Arcobacter ellisii TaxID=913109 RepID=A0A347U8L0_9BACT|nr:ATP-binding protein [Arcobacter ellisii]AXX95188.1 PAS sensor-containing two-component system histidine kinase [Arcobacter ellisii]RXI30160.1 PAS domain-containing sensor histidine kinase [Arcobacter ellisii]